MTFLQNHSMEIYWLQRRIQFLKRLDEFHDRDADADEFIHVADQFRKVENPSDLITRLKEIYGDELP